MKLVSLDFEMFDSREYWSICWVGYVVADCDFNVIESYNKLVNPQTAVKHTGFKIKFPFTSKELKKEPTFKVRANDFLPLLSGDTIVIGHAFHNDVHMIIDSCAKFDIPIPNLKYIDTDIVYSVYKGSSEPTQNSLSKLGDEFGITFVAHDPCEDATATLKVLSAICDNENVDLLGLIKKYGIVLGELKSGILTKCTSTKFSNAEQFKSAKLSVLNSYAVSLSEKYEKNTKGNSYYIDSRLIYHYNFIPLIEELYKTGGRISSTPFTANYNVTIANNSDNARDICINDFFKKILKTRSYHFYDSTCDKYLSNDYHHRIKSYVNYEKYRDFKPIDKTCSKNLKNKKIAFSDAIVKRADFDTLMQKVVDRGGFFSNNYYEASMYIVIGEEELIFTDKKPKDDLLRFLKKNIKDTKIKRQIVTINEFNLLVE